MAWIVVLQNGTYNFFKLFINHSFYLFNKSSHENNPLKVGSFMLLLRRAIHVSVKSVIDLRNNEQ